MSDKPRVPCLFGIPAWAGIKRRAAKKIIGNRMLERLFRLHGLKVGDLVSTCTGFNARVVEAEPEYICTRRGRVLFDIRLQTTTGGCSLRYCGVDIPLTFEEALLEKDRIVAAWKDNDTWGFAERCAKYIINPDGTYTVPETEVKNAKE